MGGGAERRMSAGTADTRSRALDMLRQGGDPARTESTMSTVHLNGAVSPGKAARNPQELVAFLRAKRKSGGGSQIMEAPGAGGPPGPAPPLPAAAGGDGGGASANPLLAEIEQAAMLRDQRVGAAPAVDAANPLLAEIRAAGGTPRKQGGARVDEWLSQGAPPGAAGPAQYTLQAQQAGQEMRMGESAVSPSFTGQRSHSPPPPSHALMGVPGAGAPVLNPNSAAPPPSSAVQQALANGGPVGPVNHVQDLLITNGLVDAPHPPRHTYEYSRPQAPQQPQFDPNDHVSQLLLRHNLHTRSDVLSDAVKQAQAEGQRFAQLQQQYPQYAQQLASQQQQQQQLGQVPGQPAPQPQDTIWHSLLETAQSRPQAQYPSQQYAAPQPQQPQPQRIAANLTKQALQPGGKPTFGLSLGVNPTHGRIEVTNVAPSKFAHVAVCTSTPGVRVAATMS